MKKRLLMALAGVLLVPGVQAADEAATVEQARAIAKAFGGTLKGELEKAMQAGGPVAAIDVCHSKAPAIARELSDKHGGDVHRTSLKPRATPPQDWEVKVLESFDARRSAGADPMSIEAHEVVSEGGKSYVRYMKAIGVQPVCLSCHGTEVAPEVKVKLDALYPQDKATGYSAGQLRGAFSITLPM